MKRKGHQFSNLSQSPFLSVLFKGQVSFALENLKPVVPSCPWFDPLDPTIIDKKKIFLKGGVSLPARRARHNKKCKQKKIFFLSTIFFSPFLVSLPVGPDNRFTFFEGTTTSPQILLELLLKFIYLFYPLRELNPCFRREKAMS